MALRVPPARRTTTILNNQAPRKSPGQAQCLKMYLSELAQNLNRQSKKQMLETPKMFDVVNDL